MHLVAHPDRGVTLALSYVGSSTLVTGTTSVSPTYPTGVAVGDLCVMVVVNRADTTVPTTPASWTRVSSNLVGTGTQGAGVGQLRVTVWVREAASALSGTQAVTITSGLVAMAGMTLWRRGASETWAYAPAFGHDITSATSFSVTALYDPGLIAGDMVIAHAATAGNFTASAQTLTATGATIGSVTEQQDAGSATGNDLALHIVTGSVTAGASTAPPVLAETLSGASTGGVYFLRLRAVPMVASADTLALDATTPAAVVQASGTTIVTASFTPPLGALLIALSAWDTSNLGRTTTITNTGAGVGTWRQIAMNNLALGLTGIDYAWVTSSVATTVTATFAGTGASATDGTLFVAVITGADTTTPIAQVGTIVTTTTASIEYASIRQGSRTYAVYEQYNGGSVPTASWATVMASNTVNSTSATWRQTTANPTADAAITQSITGATTGGSLSWVEANPASLAGATTPNRRIGRRTY